MNRNILYKEYRTAEPSIDIFYFCFFCIDFVMFEVQEIN